MAVPQEVLEQDLLTEEELQEQEERAREERRASLLRAIDEAEENSYSSEDDSDLARERALSIDFFLGKNVEPSPEGRSQVNDRSVFETIQWILPSLLRIYAGGGNVVEFEPIGPGDEPSAQQESDYLNYIVTQKNRWFDICLAWFQDALLTKNGYTLAYMEDYRQIETERYRRQSEMQVSLLLSEEGVEVLQFNAYPDESTPPQPVVDPMSGMPMADPMTGMVVTQPVMLYDLLIRRNATEQKLCFRVLPPERCKVSDQTPDHTLAECPYFEYWEMVPISDIRRMGFYVDDDISDDGETVDTEEDSARDRFNDRDTDDYANDPAMRRVRLRTVWIKHDTDGDGIAELQRVLLVGSEILHHQEENRIPVSSIVPYILTHRHVGLSVADIVVDIQRIMTAIMRQGLDNLYQSNNVRWAHSKDVNLDELLSSVPGGSVEVDGNPGEHLMPLVPPFLFPQAIEGLEYMDAVKEKRTGLNRTFSGVDENALRQTATGISQLSTMAAQRVEQIARVFAPGVEYLFSVAHELLLKHGHRKDVFKLRGEWVEVDPSTWKTGRDMKVTVGFGAGNKDALAGRLMNIWAMQTSPQAMQARIALPDDLYETAQALVKASDFTTNKFFTDPSTLPPPPPPPPTTDEVYAKVEEMKVMSSERVKGAEIQSKERVENATLEQRDREAKLKAQVQLKLEQMKQGGEADLAKLNNELESEPIRAETEKIAETKKAIDLLDGKSERQLTQILKKLEQLQAAVTAEKEVVRDKSGRVTGVRVKGG